MANVHVLGRESGRLQLLLHVSIPAGNNTVGVPWRTAVINSGRGGKTEMSDGDGTNGTISATEKNSIMDGSLVEMRVSLKTGGVTGPELDAVYSKYSAEYGTMLQTALALFGGTR